MAAGHPTKKSKNTAGLRNQGQPSHSSPLNSESHAKASRSQAPSPEGGQEDLDGPDWPLFQDSLKTDFSWLDDGQDDSDEMEEESDWEELNNEGFAGRIAAMVLDDDPKDKDWIPKKLQRQREKQKCKQTGEHSSPFPNIKR